MKSTDEYPSQVKIRPQIVDELTKLQRVDHYSIPQEQNDRRFIPGRFALAFRARTSP
jgi:hypothetical protein